MVEEINLITKKHILICSQTETYLEPKYFNELEYVKKNFCGIVIENLNEIDLNNLSSDTDIYISGSVENILNSIIEKYIQIPNQIFIIKELTMTFTNNVYTPNLKIISISLGQVPINICNSGIYFRNRFDFNSDMNMSTNLFQSIVSEHQFQTLTESNKPSNAFRTGIYISDVKYGSIEQDELEFNLLRCSSNLSGPTDNMRPTDKLIVDDANRLAKKFFDTSTSLNHILAQVYSNSIDSTDGKEKKAKIKTHSDKTKDMVQSGIMAFCSFYQNYNMKTKNFIDSKDRGFKKSQTNLFDYVYCGGNGETSVLTKLRFRLKSDVLPDTNLVPQFDIVLYPNSLFLMSLKTNRLYTHEIVPSGLSIDKIPTRMGYVIRCSGTKAIWKNGKTWLVEKNNNLIELTEPDEEGVKRLKELYYKQNMTSERIVYEGFNFSLNNGDYLKPNI
jgi:hypothetical protein